MSMQDQARTAVDKGAKEASEGMRAGKAKVEQSMKVAQDSYLAAGEGFREFNLKLIEIMRGNAETFFTFAAEMVNARDPGKVMELLTTHAQRQMNVMGKQVEELTSLGRQAADKNASNIGRLAGT